jgi:hypothetical protein
LSISGEIKAGKNSKYTDQQIRKCIEYLEKGHSERYVALKLGPDWTRENVRYYKRKYGNSYIFSGRKKDLKI